MKKYIYIAIIATGLFASCKKENTTVSLLNREFPLWNYQGQNVEPFGNAHTQYGATEWKLSFVKGKEGLYFNPDTSVVDEWWQKLPPAKFVPCTVSQAGNVVTINFPVANQDIPFATGRKISTALLSGSYNLDTRTTYLDGQKGFALTKKTGDPNTGYNTTTLQLLDR